MWYVYSLYSISTIRVQCENSIMCGLCPSGWMLTIVLCIYTRISMCYMNKYMRVTVYVCMILVHFLLTFSLLSEVLNAFAKHDYIFSLQHYADDSACAANAKDIMMFHLVSFRVGFERKKNYFFSHFPLYIVIFVGTISRLVFCSEHPLMWLLSSSSSFLFIS